MFDLQAWTECWLRALEDTFGGRVWFAGLQGSRGRGEAGENSDIDMVVVLDTLYPRDIAVYDAMLNALPHRDMVCGFLSGKDELTQWDPADLFQFCHDTTPLIGSLDEVLKKTGPDDAARAVRTGACNIYHACVHNMLYEKDPGALPGLYKAATFVIRAMVYQRTGRFYRRLTDLREQVTGQEAAILDAFTAMRSRVPADFTAPSEDLFRWAQKVITSAPAVNPSPAERCTPR